MTKQVPLSPPGSAVNPALYLRRVWSMRNYAWVSARHGLRASNSNAILGDLWLLLEPMILVGIYYLVFGFILRVNRGVEGYLAFLTIGQTVYTHSRRGIMQGAVSLVSQAPMLRSFAFPRSVLPLSECLNALATYAIGLVVTFVTLPIMGVNPRLAWLLMLPLALVQFLMNLGMALFLARVVNRYADVRNALPFIFQLGIYGSGVFVPVSLFLGGRDNSELLIKAMAINPFYSLIELGRWACMGTRPVEAGLNAWFVFVWTFAALVLGFAFFFRGERDYGSVRTVRLRAPHG